METKEKINEVMFKDIRNKEEPAKPKLNIRIVNKKKDKKEKN